VSPFVVLSLCPLWAVVTAVGFPALRLGRGLVALCLRLALWVTGLLLDWAVSMRRTWELDVMDASRCSHRLRVVATLPERAVVTKNLDPMQVR
jgi:hypothetical protein